MDKRRFLVGGIVAAAACAAVVRAAHPGSGGGETPALAALPAETAPAALPAEASLAALSTETALATRAPVGPTPAPLVVVYVTGEVRRPGVYRLPATGRVDDAVRAAGGQSAAADPVAVNLAERLRDGEEIVVPVRGAEPAAEAPRAVSSAKKRRRRRSAVVRSGVVAASEDAAPNGAGRSTGVAQSVARNVGARSHKRAGRRTRKEAPDAPIDVNAADAAQLETIPGIGPRLAERIVEFRETNGPFASPDELLDVNGVSERLLDEISPYVSFGSH